MRKLLKLYIRCTCGCKSYSIYTFDVHAYAKAIQFIHSMYMRIRNLFNLYLRCTCVCESYSIYTFDVHVYMRLRKLFNLIIRCRCVFQTYSIYTFDVHVYAKAIQFIHSMYMCMRKYEEILHTHVHRMYKLNSFRIHMYIECIN
jgi:hypothetical protein